VDVLQLLQVPKPSVASRDVLVKIKAVAMNPTDLKSRENLGNRAGPIEGYKILGWDGVGIVEDVGHEVKSFKKGDEVWFAGSRLRQGCHAEYCAVDESIVGKKPKSLTYEEAASLPLTGVTVLEAFYDSMRLGTQDQGKTILITGGAGGVGSIAIQIAKNVLKLKVIATASNPESVDLCKKLGADITIDHSKDLKEEMKRIGVDSVDFVLETQYIEKNIDFHTFIVKPRGIICTVVSPHLIRSESLAPLFWKSVTFTCEMMFARSQFAVEMERQRELLNLLSDLVDKKVIDHRAFTTFPSMTLENIKKAHELQASGKTRGKIVLSALFE